jgi:hypothetical protein
VERRFHNRRSAGDARPVERQEIPELGHVGRMGCTGRNCGRIYLHRRRSWKVVSCKVKNFFLVVLVVGLVIAAVFYFSSQPQAVTNKSFLSQSVPQSVALQATETPSPVPSPTMDYPATATEWKSQLDNAQNQVADSQSTAIAAQAIANNLLQSQIQVTQQAQSIELQKIQNAQQIAQWTKDAPATPTPNATGTAEVIAANMLAAKALIAHATEVSPTETIRRVNALAEANNADARVKADIVMPYFAGIIIIVFFFFLWRFVSAGLYKTLEKESAPDEETAPEQQPFAPINEVKPVIVPPSQEPLSDGFISLSNHFIPCTPVQLDELAEQVLSRKNTLPFNDYEGSKSKWTRNALLTMRAWMQSKEYIESIGGGKVRSTSGGEDMLREWRDNHRLPAGIEFYPTHADLPEGMSHEHENS